MANNDKVPKLVLKTSEGDKVFSEANSSINDFVFDQKVVRVFDDMVSRSVPYYAEMQRMTGELAGDFAKPDTKLYDIGCSTGTTFALLDGMVDPKVAFVGLDNSPEMLVKCREKMSAESPDRKLELHETDLHKPFAIENASVVTFLLTLQFIRPLYRNKIMQRIYDGLNKDGCLLLIEKVTSEDTIFNRLFIKNYYEFKKRNGYSEMEISQKREALENVLIPYRMEENIELLKEVGFKQIDVFFRWYNFCGIIAVK